MNFHKKNLILFFIFIFTMSSNLFYVNCSGAKTTNIASDNTVEGNNSNGSSTQNIDLLKGKWRANQCSFVNSNYVADLYEVVVNSNSSISFISDPSYFDSSTCAGGGVSMGLVTHMGVIIFASTEVFGLRKFYRGRWTGEGVNTSIVWALKSSNLLCIFVDSSSFKNAKDLNDYLNIIPDSVCYTKLN